MLKNINNRLIILPIVVIIAMLILSFLFSQKIQILKKEVDLIYFGNFVPIHKLHLIENQFSKIIKNKKIIYKSKKAILLDWTYYNKQYKTKQERLVLSKLNSQLLSSFKINKVSNYKKILKEIKSLINHEINEASSQRKKFLLQYEQMQNYLFYSQITIIIFVLFLMAVVLYQAIQQQRTLSALTEKYKIEMNTDALTNLYNRKYFDTIFDDLTHISQINNWNSVFIMIDIDFFKQYNDTYGHSAGDVALQKVASTLDICCNKELEYTFRIGGEEFGIIIFNASINYIKSVLDHIQHKIATLQIEHSSSKTNYLTLSMGVILIDKDTYSLSTSQLYNSADKKLYHSKENGRNQYTI